ncbi:MAG: hypothetical protein LBR80_04520 [Deltaproteobacteria bacterium]|nr:hypothetical protein [Deltaproteobacteria bacterium]
MRLSDAIGRCRAETRSWNTLRRHRFKFGLFSSGGWTDTAVEALWNPHVATLPGHMAPKGHRARDRMDGRGRVWRAVLLLEGCFTCRALVRGLLADPGRAARN